MFSKLGAIARYTLREYLRGRLLAGGTILALVIIAFEQLLGGVAITEVDATRATVAAALLRLALVLLLATAVIVSHVREAGDRTREWLLAFALPRPVWLLGRLLGHAAAALLLALLAIPALGWSAAAGTTLPWASGLALELVLCACMATFLALSLSQVPLALLAFAAWYLLARSMAALQLIAGASLLDDGGTWIRLCRHGLDLVAWLLPRLDLFAPAVWLEGGQHWAALALPFTQTLAYAALVVVATLIDLQRSEW